MGTSLSLNRRFLPTGELSTAVGLGSWRSQAYRPGTMGRTSETLQKTSGPDRAELCQTYKRKRQDHPKSNRVSAARQSLESPTALLAMAANQARPERLESRQPGESQGDGGDPSDQPDHVSRRSFADAIQLSEIQTIGDLAA